VEEVYLDNSATTKVIPEAIEAMVKACKKKYGNPSSLHGKGIEAERLIREVREKLAGFLNCQAGEIYFTSGGTEANNWAIFGAARKLRRRGKHIITTSIEHSSVLQACKELEKYGFEVTYLPVNSEGIIDPLDIENNLREDTILVSVMHVNNETGAIQPVVEAGKITKAHPGKTLFHVDAIQSFGKLDIDLKEAPVDLLSLSAHKIHGPKGIGALYIRSGVGISPIFVGGEQEGNLRAGTENVPGIAGFGAAADFIMNKRIEGERLGELKKRFITGLRGKVDGVQVNGPVDSRAIPHIINLSFRGIKGEVLVHYLEQWGIYISTGSACHSRGGQVSHVLGAMGLDREALEGAVRISFSSFTTEAEVDFAVEKLGKAVKELRSL